MLIVILIVGFLVGAGLGLWLTTIALLPASLLVGLTSFAAARFEETLIHSAFIALAGILACQAGYGVTSFIRSRVQAHLQRRLGRDESQKSDE